MSFIAPVDLQFSVTQNEGVGRQPGDIRGRGAVPSMTGLNRVYDADLRGHIYDIKYDYDQVQ